MSVVVLEILQEDFGELLGVAATRRLDGNVDFSVGTHTIDIAIKTVACGERTEHLVGIDQSGKLVVDDDLEAKLSLLPYKKTDLVAMGIGRHLTTEIVLHLCRRHHTVAVLVDAHMHNVALPLLHAFLLLAERAEEVFHQSPVEERTILVYPRHLKIGKVAHLCQWLQGGGNRTLVLVEINEHRNLIAYLQAFRHISRRQ